MPGWCSIVRDQAIGSGRDWRYDANDRAGLSHGGCGAGGRSSGGDGWTARHRMPDEALGRSGGARHTDAVALGEADETWPRIVADAEKGQLKDVYAPVDAFGQERKPELGEYPKIPWESTRPEQFNQMPKAAIRPLLKRFEGGEGFQLFR